MSNNSSNNSSISISNEDFLKIKIIGCGGAGGNIINNIMDIWKLPQECYIAIDSNASNLEKSKAKTKLQIGVKGQGSGADATQAREFAEKSVDEIKRLLSAADFLIIFAGIGGGTGTGASPVIAQAAREMGIIVLAFVTTPFDYEKKNIEFISESLERFRQSCNFTNIVSNNVLSSLKEKNLSKAFYSLDHFYGAILKTIFSIVYKQTIKLQDVIGVDIADLKFILGDKSFGFISWGYSEGSNAAVEAVQKCLKNKFIFSKLKLDSTQSLMVNIICDDNEQSASLEDIEAIFNILYCRFTNVKLNLIHSLSILTGPSDLFPSQGHEKKVMVIVTASGIALQEEQYFYSSKTLTDIIKKASFSPPINQA